MTESLAALVVALADDELVLGHRHSEWTGFAPHLEEDVAFSSIAQDEIGHAAALYALAARGGASSPDDIALGRRPEQYRNAIVCERPNRDWAYSLARHWLYDHADDVRLEALERSASDELVALARKMRREERYHLLHADAWMRRIAQGPVEGRTRIVSGLSDACGEARGLFEPLESEADALERRWLPVSSEELLARFLERTGDALDGLGLPTEVRATPDEAAELVASSSGDLIASDAPGGGGRPARPRALGGRRGRHSEDFDSLWSEMTETYRASPGATW